jgi:DNA-binding MarR family transcriptional regulator
MGRATPLLERLCGHAISLGAQSIEVEYKDGREYVIATKGTVGISIATYKSSSADAKELRRNLYATAKKPVRTIIGGQVYILKLRIFDSFGEHAFAVSMDLASKLDPSNTRSFTARQGQYLAFIYNYTKIHGQAPAESELERYFGVSPPAVHDMIKTLQRNGLIERTPGRARSIRLCVRPESLPRLE